MVGLGLYKSQTLKSAKTRADLSDPEKIEAMTPELSGLIKAIAGDVSSERSLVIFKSGTVVMVPEPCEDPKEVAGRILVDSAKSPTFAVTKIRGNYGIRYRGPVFSRIEGAAVKNAYGSILNQWRNFLNEAEAGQMKRQTEEPDFTTKVGLVARSFMLRDSQDLKVVKILRAKSATPPTDSGG